jgi:Tfp pilus assembly protein PilO
MPLETDVWILAVLVVMEAVAIAWLIFEVIDAKKTLRHHERKHRKTIRLVNSHSRNLNKIRPWTVTVRDRFGKLSEKVRKLSENAVVYGDDDWWRGEEDQTEGGAR